LNLCSSIGESVECHIGQTQQGLAYYGFPEAKRTSTMAKSESKKVSGQQKPAVPPTKIGRHKTAEIDSLQPTPERKAKTGEKS
jgi:hypothetical protein